MPRPKKYRKVKCNPTAYYFKPRAIPLSQLEEITLEIDELESLRLADYLAHSHEQAATKMKISRATFGRIVENGRKKVIDAILNGKAIKIGDELPKQVKEKILIKCGKCEAEIKRECKKNDNQGKRCKQNNKKEK
ncbi:MAG: DUF134 domain-containing protein [Ignavibacteriales bacterium]|nr:DUF134 domain-containing protein [Ignavibacteriales bacterium]